MINHDGYEAACELALQGDYSKADEQFRRLEAVIPDSELRAQIANDRGVIAAVAGRRRIAERHLQRAISLDPKCVSGASHLQLLQQAAVHDEPDRVRVVVLSLLFNWPSTGGGTVHTYELCKFLTQAGYELLHIFAKHPQMGLGCLGAPLPHASRELEFDDGSWHPDEVRTTFKKAVSAFDPDWVIVTDSWNTKPLLAEAVEDYPYFLRIAALECLCPLNNVRLLIESNGTFRQCGENQLQSPQACLNCVQAYQRTTGELHQMERSLGGFGKTDYSDRLRRAMQTAEGVFVVNPQIAELVRPHASATYVIPSGFDPQRFPAEYAPACGLPGAPRRIVFAGFTDELMKGFHVLRAAAERLWQSRQDFEILVTAEPPGQVSPYIRNVGWQSQESLPQVISDAEILVFPTIAQDALGRSAVEAMACGRPVVASRIGGLPWVVEDGVTGLLFTPGDPADLSGKLTRLLDDPEFAQRLGRAGREKFEREFRWDVILNRHYRPLFGEPIRSQPPYTVAAGAK